MKIFALALILAAGTAQAQYKCVAPSGAVTFQQTACPLTQTQQNLKVRAAPPDAVGSSAALGKSMDERILATMQRDRRQKELEQSVAIIEGDISNRNTLMTNEMNAIRGRKAYAKNNLAGATWEQSLSTEMQAVAAKHKAMNDADFERLKVLRADLDATRKLAAK